MNRHFALLGGTTTGTEFLTGLRYLIYPMGIINGSKIKEYENKFAQKVNCKFAQSFSSGRVGLYGLLESFGIEKKDEVLLQVPTHIVVSNAIRYHGAKPVYVDCCLDDYNIDLNDAKKKITSKSKILILQHTFGNPVDMDAALNLADEHNLIVIEDCVHALGAMYKGKMIGSIGHAAFFSTEETKIISTSMGGMVVTNNSDIAERLGKFAQSCSQPNFIRTYGYVLKILLYHLAMQPNIHRILRLIYELGGKRNPLPIPVSANELLGKMPENYLQLLSNAQSELAISQIERLENIIAHRQNISRIYNEILSKKNIKTTTVNVDSTSSFVRFPVWVQDREKAILSMKHKAVLGTWFTSVLEEAIHPKYGDYIEESCPNAELASKHLVNLPTHLRVNERDAEELALLLAASAV